MEPIEFQKHILARVQKLESETFEGTFEENYGSPREQAKAISDGETSEHHIGEKSPEVLKQELESHIQNFRETMTNDEQLVWNRKKQSLVDQIRNAVRK